MTLVELLVVIVLVTTLVTTAIPILSPSNEGKKLREASRAVNSYIAAAQVRAVQTGRPYGVALKRLSADTDSADDNGVCIELQQVEVPSPYAGFSTASSVRIALSTTYNPSGDNNQDGSDDNGPFWMQFLVRGTPGTVPTSGPRLPDGYQADLLPPSFLRVGDQVVTHGHTFRLTEFASDNTTANTLSDGFFPGANDDTLAIRFLAEPVGFSASTPVSELPDFIPVHDNEGQELPPPEAITNGATPHWSAPSPYKIYRQPAPASGEPMQLPAGAAIDLQASGFPGAPFYDDGLYESNGTKYAFKDPVLILFSPEGTISRVHLPNPAKNGQTEETAATSSVALCIGRRELIPATPIDLNTVGGLTDVERLEETNQFNWLNLETRWVILGALSGTITTVESTYVNPGDDPDTTSNTTFTFEEQLAVAKANAPRRNLAGGR